MYERLTKRDKYGHAYTNETIYDRGMTSKDGVHFEKHYFENGTSAYDGKPIDRLCDLEDKIEQGKILELPCAVGQTLYAVSNYYGGEWRIYECRVYDFTVYEINIFMSIRDRENRNFGVNICEIGKTVFLDRAAAEAKLRETEGERE